MRSASNKQDGYYPVTVPRALRLIKGSAAGDLSGPESTAENKEGTAMGFQKASQCLLVEDVQKSQDYYRDQLGFRIDGQFVERGGVSFLIKQADHAGLIRPNHTVNGFMETYIWVDDADAVYADLKARGAILEAEPANQSYGMREFLVYDPDGYRFCVGGPLKDD